MNAEIDDLYARAIKPLSSASKLQLLVLLARDLEAGPDTDAHHTHSILELAGLGAEIWQGIDAQKYVSQLRDEWERSPGEADIVRGW